MVYKEYEEYVVYLLQDVFKNEAEGIKQYVIDNARILKNSYLRKYNKFGFSKIEYSKLKKASPETFFLRFHNEIAFTKRVKVLESIILIYSIKKAPGSLKIAKEIFKIKSTKQMETRLKVAKNYLVLEEEKEFIEECELQKQNIKKINERIESHEIGIEDIKKKFMPKYVKAHEDHRDKKKALLRKCVFLQNYLKVSARTKLKYDFKKGESLDEQSIAFLLESDPIILKTILSCRFEDGYGLELKKLDEQYDKVKYELEGVERDRCKHINDELIESLRIKKNKENKLYRDINWADDYRESYEKYWE